MKSITIHSSKDQLESLIPDKAKSEGISPDEVVKRLLEESLGIARKKGEDHRKDFLDLFGVWSDEEAREFSNAVEDFERIDSEDWKSCYAG